jgi:hypothetical protein
MEQQKFDLPEADPFFTLDEEIAGLNAFFTSLSPTDWGASTRCEGWTVRDMVAHFDSDEAYNEACLDNTLEALAAGFSSIDEFNQKKNPPGLERKENRMIITTKQHHLSLSLEDFVAAVSARLAPPQNQKDRQLITALQTLA